MNVGVVKVIAYLAATVVDVFGMRIAYFLFCLPNPAFWFWYFFAETDPNECDDEGGDSAE